MNLVIKIPGEEAAVQIISSNCNKIKSVEQ